MKRIKAENINTPEYWNTVYHKELSGGSIRQIDELFRLVGDYALGSVLDIGCGSGALVLYLLAEKNLDAFGIDISEYAVSFGQKNNQLLKGKLEQIDVMHGLKYADKSIGTVVSLQTLEHLNDPVFVVNEMKRVARNRLIISVPKENLVPDREHVWEFTKEGLAKLLGKCLVLEVTNGHRLMAIADLI